MKTKEERKAALKASNEKAKKFFENLKKAFIELDKHRKEKEAERKAYRAGKKVKAKPQTEARLQKAAEHVERAQQFKIEPPKHEELKELLVKNNTVNVNGEERELSELPKPSTGTPTALLQTEKAIRQYISNPTTTEAKNGLNEAKTLLGSFDDHSAAVGGLFTALLILALVFIFSKL